MREFGPTPFPAFSGAAIVGVRALGSLYVPDSVLAAVKAQDMSLLRTFDDESTTPDEEPETPEGDTSDPEAVAVTDEPREHSARSIPLRTRIRAARIAREWE